MEQFYVFVKTEDSHHRRTISSLFSKPLRPGRNVGMRTSGGYVRPHVDHTDAKDQRVL